MIAFVVDDCVLDLVLGPTPIFTLHHLYYAHVDLVVHV